MNNVIIGFLADEVALFWGLQAYNNELLKPDQRQLGSVSTEILFEKDSGMFILRNGWGLASKNIFQRRGVRNATFRHFPCSTKQ